MDTERLYFSDAYLTRFSARVIARAERGGRPARRRVVKPFASSSEPALARCFGLVQS